MAVDHYYTLGRSGLRVSRLALGTMTFGADWGWGSDENAARTIFQRYLEAGGKTTDTLIRCSADATQDDGAGQPAPAEAAPAPEPAPAQ